MRHLCWLLLLLAPAWAAEWAPAIEKTVLEELRETKTPGAAIGIVLDGKLVYARGFGTSNVETGAPVGPDLLFRLGSTTKMLTAAAVASLAAEGKVKFEDPVGRYVSGLHPAVGALTIGQLLSHTAGLRDAAVMNGRHDDAALGEEIRAWKADWLFAQPGKIYSYSNPGFWLAGYAAEVVDGAPYAEVMERRVFAPLGMSHTTLRPTMAMTRAFSQGHEAGVLRPAPDNAANWPAGSVFSSVDDLAKFVIALMDGRFPALTVARTAIPGSAGHYGFGLALDESGGVRVWSHGGSRAGYGSYIAMVPERRNAVIVLCNRTGQSLPKSVAAIGAVIGIPARKEASATERSLEALEFVKYAGVYRNGEATVTLGEKNGKLMVDTNEVKMRADGGLVLRDADGREQRRFVAVTGAGGQVEFLFSGGRALARQAR